MEVGASGERSRINRRPVLKHVKPIKPAASVRLFLRGLLPLLAAEDGDDVFDRHHEELVVGLEIDGDRVFRVEQDLVVLPQGKVFVVFDLGGDGDDPAGDRGNLGLVGQGDAPLGFPFGFVLADEDAGSNRFDVFEGFLAWFWTWRQDWRSGFRDRARTVARNRRAARR